MKKCTACEAEKALDLFARDSKAKDGRCTRCKDCCSAKAKVRYQENREAILQRVRAYTAANHEAKKQQQRDWYARERDAVSAKAALRYRANPEPIKLRAKRVRIEQPEVAAARISKWRSENKAQMRAHNANRRARVRKAQGTHSASDVQVILKGQRWKCAVCKADLKRGYEVDHVQPIALGGSNWPENLQCLCPPCNRRKHAKDPIAFAYELGRLL